MKSLLAAVLAIALLAVGARAQSEAPCDPPALPSVAAERNIFSNEQEGYLGDAIADHITRSFGVIEDEALTAYLARVGARIAEHLPATSRPAFRYYLVDIPDANAFVLPGGRVYVSRKLVALARTEDELAGVIAHEMGHLAARHNAIGMTRLFREVLGVTSVGDRRDVFDKYNQLVENYGRKPKAFEGGDDHENAEQQAADRIGLYALVKAGYAPGDFTAFFDRLVDTKGKTGNFFSDIFGRTKPEAKRLRKMLEAVAALPPGCTSERRPAPAEEFTAWQASVVAYSGIGRRESLRGVRSKIVLEPPLRSEVTHLRFSPNGRYVLAQDDAGVNVLSREPFEFLFRIEAPEARPAAFTPDSRQIAFHNANLRVELWSLEDRAPVSMHEVFLRKACLQTVLAPDGATLGCLDEDLDLVLYDVATGEQLYRKKSFYTPNPFQILILQILGVLGEDGDGSDFDWISMEFSPDGKYFVAGARSAFINAAGGISMEAAAVAVDMATRQEVSLKKPLKKLVSGGFTFLSANRLLGTDREKPDKSGIIAFPSGEMVDEVPLPGSKLSAVTSGNYALLRPFNKSPVGVLDLATDTVIKMSQQPAIDMHGDVFVSEMQSGEIGLYGAAKNDLRARLLLPRGTLGRLRAATISPDLKWLAVSERLRGAVWNLSNGERLFHLRGFRGGHFAEDALHADFPKHDEMARSMARLDLASRRITIDHEIGEASARQSGGLLVLKRAAEKGGSLRENVVVEVRNALDDALLWSKAYKKEAPGVWASPGKQTVVLSWAVSDDAAKAEIKADARLGRQLQTMREKEGDYYLQVLDARTGKQLGHLLVETGKGSFRIADVFASGDWVVVADTQNRVLLYSLATGEVKGRVFGTDAAVAPAGDVLCVETERGQLAVYDLGSMERRDQLTFTSPISMVRFGGDGASLFVLTADQTAYVIDVGALGARAGADR